MRDHHPIFNEMQLDGKYFVIPTQFLLDNLLDDNLWGVGPGCPDLVNYEILECIRELKAAGKFPYNSTVGQLFCDKKGLGSYQEHSFFIGNGLHYPTLSTRY